MTASKLYPKMYQGKEDSSGYLAQNDKPSSRDSPLYRGRLYIEGVGWYWLSGWPRPGKRGELISISLRGMTDQEAEQYCAPRQSAKTSQQSRDRYEPPSRPDTGDSTGDDIPF